MPSNLRRLRAFPGAVPAGQRAGPCSGFGLEVADNHPNSRERGLVRQRRHEALPRIRRKS